MESTIDDESYEGDEFAADADFYDGPTGDEGKPYDQLGVSPDQLLARLGTMFGPIDEAPAPAPEPVWDRPLLTPEEFMAKYGLKGGGT